MSRMKILSLRKGYDGPIYPMDPSPEDTAWEESNELGERFVQDKEKLDEAIAKIESSNLSPANKAVLIQELRASILQTQNEYQENVSDQQAQMEAVQRAHIEQLEKNSNELYRTEQDLKSVHLDVSSADTGAAADAAALQRQAVDDRKEKWITELNRQIEESERQRHEILRNRSDLD